MPEEVEIDTDKLNEDIKEEIEREGGTLLKAIALTTALFAALAAVAALRAGGTVNEALVLKTEATRLQAEASDQWAAYQAKGIKSAILGESETLLTAQGKQAPATFENERERYRREQSDIENVARTREHERDEKSAEADELLHRHHRFADAVALFQVAIALGAIAALARYRIVWFLSMLLGVIGAGFFIGALL
ncbi:MAG TPA: DUF4337 family protein [Candidatus Binataceae bacterium]|nr:DUF4337 family protein [Candidatus Binataceae bacterium]